MSEVIQKIESTAKTHLNNIMQIAVFSLNDNNYYGINVSKIRSFEDYNRYVITKNNTINCDILEGYIQYQKTIIPVLNLEKWLGIYKDSNEYKIHLVCEYNKTTVAFPILFVHNIFNVQIEKLQRPEIYFDAVTYNTNLVIDGVETTCMVLDVEKLLFDVFGENVNLGVQFNSFEKKVLIAEDSNTAQKIIQEILSNGTVRYQIFNDGEKLIEFLNSLDDKELSDIGLVITDIEMPRKDGYQVIKFIKEHKRFEHIPVVVNSSMSNVGVELKTKMFGAVGFITKTDPENFINQIEKNILR